MVTVASTALRSTVLPCVGPEVDDVRRTAHRKARGRGMVVLAALTAVLLGPLLAPASAGPGPDKTGVHAITTQTAAVVPGQSAWLSVVWGADQTVTDWSTTVTAPAGVGVSYPTTRGGSDTSLYGSATLVGTTRDFTAFKLSVPYTRTAPFQITLQSTYTSTCGDNGQCKNNGGGNDDKVRDYSTAATVTVPVVPATGPEFTQDTARLTVLAGSNAFVQLAFTGGQADLSDFTVRLVPVPAALAVAYPGDAAVSRPAGGSALRGRTTDQIAVRLDATTLARGTYTLPLLITYSAAAPRSTSGTVTLVVQ